MKGKLGCLAVLAVVIGIIIWIRWSDARDARESEIYDGYAAKLATSRDKDSTLMLLEAMYEHATYTSQKMQALTNMIFMHETAGESDKALAVLDRYDNEFGHTAATAYHRACILNSSGDSTAACRMLLEIAAPKVPFKPLSAVPRMFLRWLESGHRSELERYEEYFHGNICRVYAMMRYCTINGNKKENLERIKGLLRDMAEVDAIAETYLEKKNEYGYEYNPSFEHEVIDLKHLYIDVARRSTSLAPPDYLTGINNLKWDILNTIIMESDTVEGLEATRRYLAEAPISEGALNFSDRFFVRAYRSYAGLDGALPTATDYADYKSWPKNSFKILVMTTPDTSEGSSALIANGITGDRIVLRYNDWCMADSLLLSQDIINANKDLTKRLVLLRDDYRTDTIVVAPGRIGVAMRPVYVPDPVYYMIISDFIKDRQ